MVLQKTSCVITTLLTFMVLVFHAAANMDPSTRKYLEQYGYLQSSSEHGGALLSEDTMHKSLIRFQKMAGIPQTGVADDATAAAMAIPRCGVMDEDKEQSTTSRRRRFAWSGRKWRRNDLTYRITRYTPDLPQHEVDTTIQRAFKVWSDVTPLTFTRRPTGSVDIEIIFAAGSHGDNNPFDGPAKVLAHAYFPQTSLSGDAHFDEAERWTVRTYSGTNLFQVAAHEFGHSLGLKHSEIQDALMAPFYRGYKPNFKLHSDDVNGIQRAYGRNTQSTTTKSPATIQPSQRPSTPKRTSRPSTYQPSTTPRLRTTAKPTSCQPVVPDAVTLTADGSTYMFQGEYYYLIGNSGAPSGYPRKISSDWRGLPSNIDAALYLRSRGYTYFFKGNKYWKFYNRFPISGYPRYIRYGFPGFPNDIDAAFVWGRNGRTYVMKGNQYYRYSWQGLDNGYPRPLSVWKGLPSRVSAAFQYGNGRTYFFSGTQYYRFNDLSLKVDSTYPRNTVEWWICPRFGNLVQADNTNTATVINDTKTQTNQTEKTGSEDGSEEREWIENEVYKEGVEMKEKVAGEQGENISGSNLCTVNTMIVTVSIFIILMRKYINGY